MLGSYMLEDEAFNLIPPIKLDTPILLYCQNYPWLFFEWNLCLKFSVDQNEISRMNKISDSVFKISGMFQLIQEFLNLRGYTGNFN